MSRDPEFSSKLAFGTDGERWGTDNILRPKGWHVMPLWQFTSHSRAPFIQMVCGQERTLPDVIGMRNGIARLFEFKRKTRWVTFTGTNETGFNRSHYEDYLEIRKETGIETWVLFLHEGDHPNGVYAAEILTLEANVRLWDGKNQRTGQVIGKPEALFPITALRRIGDFIGISTAA